MHRGTEHSIGEPAGGLGLPTTCTVSRNLTDVTAVDSPDCSWGTPPGTPVGTPAPGDILFFDRDDNGVFEHTGIFLGVNNDNGVVEWVEAHGFGPGATSANGHSVTISAYAGSGIDQINRAF